MLIELASLAIAIVAIIISTHYTRSAKKASDLLRNETIEKNVTKFIIDNRNDIGWLPQCAALNIFPLAHTFDRSIFHNFQLLTASEQKYMFDRYSINIPARIPEDKLRNGIELLLDDMTSKKIMSEEQRHYPMGQYRARIEGYSGSIRENTGTSFMSYVPWKHGSQRGDGMLESFLGDRLPLNNYIQYFLYENRESLLSPLNFILSLYEFYEYGRQNILVTRLNELCYFSLIELDDKGSMSIISDDLNANFEYFEDAVLSLTLGAYLAYVHKEKLTKPNIPYDGTTVQESPSS